MRVLIIGAGLTGSMIARLLQSSALAGALEIHVWDKARGVGGRASVRRSTRTGGQTDTGAQYLTEVSDLPAAEAALHRAFYDELAASGVIAPMVAAISGGRAADGTGQNWVAPAGLNTISKHLLGASGATLALGRRVSGIERAGAAPGGGAGQWRVRLVDASPAPGACGASEGAPAAAPAPVARDAAAADGSDGAPSTFDAVVVTLPVPQLLALEGEVAALLAASPALLDALRAVQYSSRFALSLFWAADDAAARAFFESREWACVYFEPREEPDLVFAARCAAKRGRAHAEPPSLVVHSSVPFALARAGVDADAAGAEMLDKLRARWPEMPPPLEARTTRWALSQVRRPLAGAPAALALGDGPPLIVAGDALSRHGSRFDGCVESARRAVELLGERLGLPAPTPGSDAEGA